jgi:hypothetical protein
MNGDNPMKKATIIALSMLFILSCLAITKNPGVTNANAYSFIIRGHFYIERHPWDSPFDPHQVMAEWKKLSVTAGEYGGLEVWMGSSIVPWEQYNLKDKNLPLKAPKPRGDVAAIIMFNFMVSEQGLIELVSYGYYDEYGALHCYRWNIEKMKYTRHIVYGLQSNI